MRRGRAALVAVAAFGACTRGEPARPIGEALPAAIPVRDFQSGTRLRARTWVLGDIEALRDFFDVELGAPCAFDLPARTRRCLPVLRAVHREGAGPFADSRCTEPYAAALDGAAAYAIVTPVDACAASPAVRRAGALEERRPFFRDGDVCRRGIETIPMQPLGEVVPDETFVAAHEENEGRSGRIDARVLVADDGARQVVAGFDRVREEVVSPDDAADGTLRWLPARVAFRNAGAVLPPWCSDAATKIASSAVCPLSAALVLEGACGEGTYRTLGDAVPGCLAGSLAFAIGEAIPPASFARATYADLGRGAVRRRSIDGVRLTDLVDAETGEPCAVAPAADGAARCLPRQTELVAYFADAACETRAFAHPLTGCERAFASLVRDGVEAFEVVGEVEALFELRGGACAPFAPTVPAKLFSVRALDPTRFAAAAEHRD